MTVASIKFLLFRLLPDAAKVMEIADEQVDHILAGRYAEAIRFGDYWRKVYTHVPHTMLFDMWSARAEIGLGRGRPAVLRILRADMTLGRWERAVVAERIELRPGEKALIQNLVVDFHDTLMWIRDECGHAGFLQLLSEEYGDRIALLEAW